MVLAMVKNAAKRAFSKKGTKLQVLTLVQILNLSYVKEVMTKADVHNITKSYNSAPEDAKLVLCEKLLKIDTMYQGFANEKDPDKRKAQMVSAIQDGVVKIKEDAKKLKTISLRKLESTERSKELGDVENKITNI